MLIAVKTKHGDHKGRHYYTSKEAIWRFVSIVVATLAVAMLPKHRREKKDGA